MIKTLRSFAQDERGVTGVEYGLLAGLIAVVLIPVITLVGTNLSAKFAAINTGLH